MNVFITVMVTLFIGGTIGVDAFDDTWQEKRITHEHGELSKVQRVVCFNDGRSLCAYMDKWESTDKDIHIKVFYEYNHNTNKIRDLQSTYGLQQRYIFPINVANPLNDHGQCILTNTKDYGPGFACDYNVNINLHSDTIKVKTSPRQQIWHCGKIVNSKRMTIRCRELMLSLLPLEKNKYTGEVRLADNRRYRL